MRCTAVCVTLCASAASRSPKTATPRATASELHAHTSLLPPGARCTLPLRLILYAQLTVDLVQSVHGPSRTGLGGCDAMLQRPSAGKGMRKSLGPCVPLGRCLQPGCDGLLRTKIMLYDDECAPPPPISNLTRQTVCRGLPCGLARRRGFVLCLACSQDAAVATVRQPIVDGAACRIPFRCIFFRQAGGPHPGRVGVGCR